MERFVSIEHLRGEPSGFKQIVKKKPDDCIETFVDVSGTASDRFALELTEFDAESSSELSVFSTIGRGGACK